MAASLLYRFLGGTKNTTFAIKGFKATGSAAVVAAAVYFVNDQLVKQNPIIDPHPSSWVAINNDGAITEVKIGPQRYGQDVSRFLRDAVWNAKLEDGAVRVKKQDQNLGKINLLSLNQLHFFNRMAITQRKGIRYTGELTAGEEEDLQPVYPYKIQATQFADGYNGFRILDQDGSTVLHEDSLRTKNFQFFTRGEEHFLIFVSRAVHNDPQRVPWAAFGFAQVSVSLTLEE